MFSYSAYLLVWHLNVAQLESESVVESYIASMLKTTRILNLRWRYIDNGWKQSFAAVYCVIPVSRIHTSSKTIVSINTFAIRIPYDSIETFSIVSHLYYAFLTIDKLFFFLFIQLLLFFSYTKIFIFVFNSLCQQRYRLRLCVTITKYNKKIWHTRKPNQTKPQNLTKNTANIKKTNQAKNLQKRTIFEPYQ